MPLTLPAATSSSGSPLYNAAGVLQPTRHSVLGRAFVPYGGAPALITLPAAAAYSSAASFAPVSLIFGTVPGPYAGVAGTLPTGIAFGNLDGSIYTASASSINTTAYTSSGYGTFVTVAGVKGLACDLAGNVYAGNTSGGNIKIYTITGAAATAIAGGTIGSGLSPTALAIDAAGNVWVANGAAGNVKIFTNTGAASSIAGGTIACGIGALTGITIDLSGNVYVSGAGGIKIYTSTGGTSTICGGSYTAISNVLSVAVDPTTGILYVATSTSVAAVTSSGVAMAFVSTNYSSIVAFDQNGLLWTYGFSSSAGGNVMTPYVPLAIGSSLTSNLLTPAVFAPSVSGALVVTVGFRPLSGSAFALIISTAGASPPTGNYCALVNYALDGY